MNDPVSDEQAERPRRGRIPTAADASTLHARVEAVLRVLEEAAEEEQGNAFAPSARLLEKYRPLLYDSMAALSDQLVELFEREGGSVDLEVLRAEFLAPIIALSRSLPVFQRAGRLTGNSDEIAELHGLLLGARLSGYDVPTLLLDDFYLRGDGAESLRTRAAASLRLAHAEMQQRLGAGQAGLRVLILGANGILTLGPLLVEHERPENISIVLVDAHSPALRSARQYLEKAVGLKLTALRAAPLRFPRSPSRPSEGFDVIYALSLYDTLAPGPALEFTRDLVTLLKPGGALVTGSYMTTLSRRNRALAYALVGMKWSYWDEAGWRSLLSQLPFDLDASRLEVFEPATLAVLARREFERSP